MYICIEYRKVIYGRANHSRFATETDKYARSKQTTMDFNRGLSSGSWSEPSISGFSSGRRATASRYDGSAVNLPQVEGFGGRL